MAANMMQQPAVSRGVIFSPKIIAAVITANTDSMHISSEATVASVYF